MPYDIDPETIHIDELPGIWSPIQWEMSDLERLQEMEMQATASLISCVDVPEAVLRLLLNETTIERAFDPPQGYDPEEQGEWDPDIITYQFNRRVQLIKVEREENYLYLEYKVEDLGYWAIEIETDQVNIYRI
jgi:hypothetical protein